jgi:hypothetical protein
MVDTTIVGFDPVDKAGDTMTGGSGGAPNNATYIVQTADATLSNEQALGALATGIVKNTTTTGVLSIAAEGTDYLGTPSIGVSVQAYDATLLSIAALGTAADKMAYTTGVDTWAETDITTAGRAILDDATAGDQRTTLGLGTIATQAASNVAITGGTTDSITATSLTFSTGSIGTAVTGVTQSASDNSTKLATTAYADAAGGGGESVKVWLNMSGDGTTINDSFNVTSVADTAGGRITITIATDFANANYACNVTTSGNQTWGYTIGTIKDATIAVGSIEVNSVTSNFTTRVDPEGNYHVIMAGDQ